MQPTSALTAALVAAFAGVLGLVAPAPAAGASQSPSLQTTTYVDDSALAVRLGNVSPSTMPRRGPIRLTGTVTNQTDQTWIDVNVLPYIDGGPLQTVTDLEIASESDPASPVNYPGRITAEPHFDKIGDLEPGENAVFSVTIPRDVIAAATESGFGAYWVGVHALGQDEHGRDEFADGRARTFLPFLRPQPARVRTALVVPIRRSTSYEPDGRLADLDSWLADLRPGGRLRNVVDFGFAQEPGDVTWLIDPAVLDAVRRIARGNPPRYLGATRGGSPDGESPGPTPSADTDPAAADQPLEDQSSRLADEARGNAQEWLTRLREATEASEVLGLPYGDLAVDAAHQEAPGLVARALELSAQAFESFEITAQPVVAPPYGILTPATLRGLDPALPVLVSDASLGEAWPDAAQEPTDLKVGRHPVLLYDAGASAGGPGPDNPLAPTALRQRIIAEAGLRSLQGQDRLVVSLPVNWDPGANSQRFGDEIGVPWLRFDSLTSVTTDARPTRLDELAMSRRRRSLATNVAAVARLVGAGRTLQNLLTNNTSVEEEVIAAALPMASYFSAGSRGAHIRAAEAAIDWIDAQLAKVTISAQSYVTLSSASGRIRVDLRNGLEQPVTVKIGAFRTSPIEISAPGQVTLEAGGTTSVLINAEATQLGMHRVRLYVTDSEDTALGAYDDLPIRATEVGQTIWVIMAVGASMFAVAILARISRQVAARKRAAAGGAEEEA